MAAPASSPWLVLIHQLPPKPPYFRVKVWRRLQALGAVAIKNSVYVLPNTEEAREDFEWVLREIQQEGGEVSLCEARLVDGLTDEDVQRSFRTARENDYRELARDVRTFAQETLPRRGRSLSSEARSQAETSLERFRKRLGEIGKVDFFGAPGREAVEGLLGDLEGRLGISTGSRRSPSQRTWSAEDVRGRTWVTRTGVHIDRMASAWLIARFIDEQARFRFAPSRGYPAEPAELRFDMFEAEFTHDGELCTFEVLVRDFGLSDPALGALGEIVHDIDLKDAKYERPETLGVEHLIAGIAWANPADEQRLEKSSTVFEALYAYFKRRKA